MPKLLKDILNGVKKSKIVPGSTGSDPGVDYAPKAPNEQEFVKKHEREKHEDRVGNGDDIYQATNIKHSQASDPKHGYKKPQDKNVNEAKETTLKHYKGWGEYGPTGSDRADVPHVIQAKDSEAAKRKAISHLKKNHASWNSIGDRNVYVREVTPKTMSEATKCNMTEEGVSCPVHEMADCSKVTKTLREVAKNPYAVGMAAAMKSTGDKPPLAKSTIVKAHDIAKSIKNEDLAVPLLGGKDNDESAEMAKTQLRALANKALHLAMQLGDDQVVEPWVQAKIAVAKDNVTAVHDYMVYGDHSKNKENEQTAPYDGGIDMTSGMTSGIPSTSLPNFSVDVGRNV